MSGPAIAAHNALSIADVVERQAMCCPQRPAIVTDDWTWTYADLARRVRSCAQALRTLGFGPGDRLATAFPHTPHAVPWTLAIGALGAVAVPINTRLAPPEVAAQLEDADVAVVLEHPGLSAWLEPVRELVRTRSFHRVPEEVEATDAPPLELGAVHPECALTLLYTSGSTGRPKGCALSHRSFVTASFNLFYGLGLGSEDRHLATMPLFHVGGLAFVLSHLHGGATVVFSGSADPPAMIEAIQRHGITMTAVPFVSALLDEVEATGAELPTLRIVTWGSQMERPETLRRIGPVLGAEWRGMFGSTECGNVGFLTTLEMELAHPGTIGRPVPGLVATVRDLETDEPLGPGEIGELCVRGPSTMTEYWRNEEATAETLRNGWVHMGDLARFDEEGLLHFEGRAKDMIKSGGENVFAQEVERVLLRVSGVADAAVFGVPDTKWGEAVVAAICVEDGSPPSPEQIDATLRASLAGYKVPKAIAVVDEIPKFQGKPRKLELRQRWVAGEIGPR